MAAVSTLAVVTRYVFSHDHVLIPATPTGAAVIEHAWVPDVIVLSFLLMLWGISTTHFAIKRATDVDYAAVKQGTVSPAPATK